MEPKNETHGLPIFTGKTVQSYMQDPKGFGDV